MITLKLDELLTERNLTAYALAKKTGLHQSVISKIRRNESQALRLDVLGKLCAALECQPGDLIVSDNRITTRNVDATRKLIATRNTDATRNVDATRNTDATRNEKQLSLSNSDGLLTLTQVAERLGLSRKRVNDYVNKGELPATKGKQGHNFVSEADLQEFIENR
jgi:putative transcriptional regulator